MEFEIVECCTNCKFAEIEYDFIFCRNMNNYDSETDSMPLINFDNKCKNYKKQI